MLNKSVIDLRLLKSMIKYPPLHKAKEADVSEVVRQRSDIVILSGESAMGQ